MKHKNTGVVFSKNVGDHNNRKVDKRKSIKTPAFANFCLFDSGFQKSFLI